MSSSVNGRVITGYEPPEIDYEKAPSRQKTDQKVTLSGWGALLIGLGFLLLVGGLIGFHHSCSIQGTEGMECAVISVVGVIIGIIFMAVGTEL